MLGLILFSFYITLFFTRFPFRYSYILWVMESMGSLWIGIKEYAAWWTFWVVATEWLTSEGFYAISLCQCVYCLLTSSFILFFLVFFFDTVYMLLVMESMGSLWIGIKEYAAWWTFWVVATEWLTSKGYYAISLCQYVYCLLMSSNLFSFFQFCIFHIFPLMSSILGPLYSCLSSIYRTYIFVSRIISIFHLSISFP